jgi:hypothetical protein
MQMPDEVENLVAALTAWEAAHEAWREACGGVVTEEAVEAYETARAAWLDAQDSVPEEQAYATFWEALRVHQERNADRAGGRVPDDERRRAERAESLGGCASPTLPPPPNRATTGGMRP